MRQNKTLISFFIVVVFELFLQRGLIDPFTCVFIGVILAILLYEKKYARDRLQSITQELQNSLEPLNQCKVNPTTRINIKAEKIFEHEFMRGLLREYIIDYNANITAQKKKNVDISEYINENSIGVEIKKNLTDLMPGMMTALGILGTFIGLTFGLEEFHIGDNTAALTENISGLTDGIKIAFHTSIIGVFMSLLYNVFYSQDIADMKTALSEFYVTFDKIIPEAKDEALEKLLGYQEVQTEALLSLSNNISTGIADKMAEAIERTIKPQMEGVAEKINSVIGEVKDTLDTYITKTVDSQTKTMQTIVDKFMDTLNKAMDDQFKNLSMSIEKMCDWQGVTTENIKGINEMMTPLVDELKSQNQIVSENNNKSMDIVREVTSLLRGMKEYSLNSITYLNQAQKHTEVISDLNEKIKTYFGDVSAYFDTSKEAFVTIGDLMETINDEREKTDKYQETLTMRLSQMDKASKMLTDRLTEYMTNIIKLDEAYKKLISGADMICSKMAHENEESKKTYAKLVEELEESHRNNLEQMREFMDEIKESQEEIIRNTEHSVLNIRHNLMNIISNFTKSLSHDDKKEEQDK